MDIAFLETYYDDVSGCSIYGSFNGNGKGCYELQSLQRFDYSEFYDSYNGTGNGFGAGDGDLRYGFFSDFNYV